MLRNIAFWVNTMASFYGLVVCGSAHNWTFQMPTYLKWYFCCLFFFKIQQAHCLAISIQMNRSRRARFIRGKLVARISHEKRTTIMVSNEWRSDCQITLYHKLLKSLSSSSPSCLFSLFSVPIDLVGVPTDPYTDFFCSLFAICQLLDSNAPRIGASQQWQQWQQLATMATCTLTQTATIS